MTRRISLSAHLALLGVPLVAGVDEAGRGCLAGPVYAAAVILEPGHGIRGLDDSKKLNASERERLFDRIHSRARAFAIARAELDEIESLNILHASMLAMQRAVEALQPAPLHCLIDGNRLPRQLPCPAEAVIGGDGIHAAIMAASILAKVARDREMQRLDREYPGYGFAQHKGYGTAEHLAALRRLGVSPQHRMGFGPCMQSDLFTSESALEAALGNALVASELDDMFDDRSPGETRDGPAVPPGFTPATAAT